MKGKGRTLPPVRGFCASVLVVAAVAMVWHAPVGAMEPPPAPDVEQNAEDGTVLLRGFRFSGNTSIPDGELASAVEQHIGTRVDLDGLRAITEEITTFYQERGLFLSRAYIPEQDIDDGIVEIGVIEGAFGRLHIDGNEHYSDEFISAFFDVALEDGPYEENFERALMILNQDFEGLSVTSVLERSDEPGKVDVRLDVTEDAPFNGTVFANNFGSDFVSRYRLGAQLGWTNAFTQGDHATLTGLVGDRPDDLAYGMGRYSMAVNAHGTKVGLHAAYGNFDVSRDFQELGLTGRMSSGRVFVSHPFVRTREMGLVGEFAFEAKESEMILLDTTNSRDRIRLLHAGLALDRLHHGGRSYAAFDVFRGLGGVDLDPTLPPSRPGGVNEYTRATVSFARVQPVHPVVLFLGRFAAQVSDSSLLAVEEFQIGGADSVRGFGPGEFSGDSGYTASVEFRFSPLEEYPGLAFAAFIDHGRASRREVVVGQPESETLTGAGVGLRVNLRGDRRDPEDIPIEGEVRPDRATRAMSALDADLRLDIAWPVTPNSNSLGERPVLYASAVFRF